MNKYQKNKACKLPTLEELRASLSEAQGSAVREQLALLFDEKTFVETAAYTKRAFSDFLSADGADEFESVITGYGAIDGKLTFAFAEDSTRTGGVIDERHAKKIVDLYRMAIENGAPMIGIFNSNGTDVFEGTAGLAAYGKIMSAVAKASGVIPQIALITGKCIGTSAAIASMFDFVVKEKGASFYVSSPAILKTEGAQDSVLSFTADSVACAGFVRALVSYLPSNSDIGTVCDVCTDNLNRKLGNLDFSGDAISAISVIADNGVFYELAKDFAPSVSTVFATLGGVKCGIVANSFAKDSGKIDCSVARKIAKFVSFCSAFSIPVVTLVDSLGLAMRAENEPDFAPELAKLAFAYANSDMPKVTVIIGHAIGAAFALLGSKALGADVVYATDDSEIGALTAERGVAFAWDKYITEEKNREDLICEWKLTVSSPAVAAASGEIDDIIGTSELRARICSALLMLANKGSSKTVARRKVLPL